MARSIVVTSGKGGVGKTTLVANLGRILAQMGQRVVIMDTDIGLNNLDVIMNVENRVVYDIIDVIENRCRIRQALIEDRLVSGLFVMPSAHSYDKSMISGQNIKALINVLSTGFDYILLDCPAGIEMGFHRAVSACSEALVVTTPHISSLRDADKVLRMLKSYQIKYTNVVVNRARGDMMLSSQMVSVEDVEALLKQRPIGVIPDDDAVNALSNVGIMTNPGGDGWKALEMTACNLHYGTNALFDVTKRYKGMFGGLKRSLRKII